MNTLNEFCRILVIRFRFVGDVLLTTPALQVLRRRFPECYLAMLTDAAAAEVVEGHPALNEVMVFKPAGRERGWSRWRRYWQLMRHIRQQRFDLVFNLQPGDRGGLVAWWSGARGRVGYARPGERMFFYNVRAPYLTGARYRVEHVLDALRAVGIEAEAEPPSLGLTEADRGAARAFLDGHHPVVVLHPGRPSTRKTWQDERWTELADSLAERHGARVIFAGAPPEAERVQRIAAAMRHPSVSVAGKLNLKELAALIERVDLFIGIDSAPLHLTSAVGTPSVALFGFSNPVEWNPPGAEHIALHKPLAEHPCCPPHCCEVGQSPCMKNITVEDVMDAAERLLELRVRS